MDSRALESVLAVLKRLGGYFVLADGGEEYVLVGKEYFDELQLAKKGRQLSLSAARGLMSSIKEEKEVVGTDRAELKKVVESGVSKQLEKNKESVDDVLERINRDIALYRLQQEEETELDDELRSPQKVKFEPLKGDLPPELQE